MDRTLNILLFLLFPVFVNAQDNLPAFGKPDRWELELKTCIYDRDAPAFKLLDLEEKEVFAEYGLKIKTKRRVKIKIFNEKGFDWATIIIPFSRTKGARITDLTGYIHYLDSAGNIITYKIDKRDVFKDNDDNSKKVKFTFPNVRAGCVVEYRYEKIEKNSLHLEPWFFQDMIPTLRSSYTLALPSRAEIDYRVVGFDTATEKKNWKRTTKFFLHSTERSYSLNNVPAFKPEPMMSSVADNLYRVEFALQPSGLGFMGFLIRKSKWEIMARVLNEVSFFGEQFHVEIPGTEMIVDSAKALPIKEDRINYIFQRVKKHIKWDGVQTFYSGELAEVWKEKTGNSAEINLTVLNLLRKAGIPCSPILVSTRTHGQIDESFFTLSQFNGVDVLINDSTGIYVLDGTRKHQSFQTPPDNILNRKVLNMDTAAIDWLFISDNRAMMHQLLTVTGNVSEDGTITGKAVATYHHHSKAQRLQDADKTEEEEREEEKEFLQKDFAELKIDSLVLENEDDDLLPLVERFNFSYQPSVTGDFLFLDPFFLSRFRKNPFLDSTRNTSLDFGSLQFVKTSVDLTLPEHYEVDHVPKNIRLRMADTSIVFDRKVTRTGRQIRFDYTIEVLYPVFEKEYYPAIRDFFIRMYGYLTEQVILKKK